MAIAGDCVRSRLDANRDRSGQKNGHMPITVDIGSFGSAVRDRREAQGVSLRRLARRACITPAALSLIERGEVTPSWLNAWRICGALEVSLGELVDEIQEEIPSA